MELQQWEKDLNITENRFDNHHAYYFQLASVMGIGWPNESNRFMGKTKSQWTQLYEKDEHLNNHPLANFDSLHGFHRTAAAKLKIPLSPSMTVCMLKAVIIEKINQC